MNGNSTSTTFIEEYDIGRIAFAYENIDIFYDKDSQETNKKQVVRFLENILINEGSYQATYNFAKYTNYGRKYSYGIQCVKKNIRNFLLADSGVVDYDIKMAHPSILHYLCEKHQIHTDKHLLRDYVLNRDDVLDTHFKQETFEEKDVKKLILTATNSDDELYTKNEWLKSYQAEMVVIRDALKKIKDYKKILADTERIKQDKANQNSSFVNRILCKIESEIVDKFASFTGKNVFALMFDGILVNEPNKNLLEDYNTIVTQTYGHFFKIVEKPIETTIVMGDYVYDLKDILGSIDSYETRMELYIETFNPLKIISPPLYGFYMDDDFVLYKKEQFIQATEHIRYTNDRGENVPIVNNWLKEKITPINTFGTIITDPAYTGTKHYNLWRQWDILNWTGEWNNDEEAVKYMRNHLLILCNNDKGVANTVELWMSHLLKYPKSKSFVPIFIGKQGTGKDMLFSWITTMIGEDKKFETASPERDIWGNFNPMMKSAYLIHLSEFGRKNTQEHLGKIKAITTTGKICINEKNKGEYEINSYHRFVGASNYAEPIPMESDNRRFLLIQTSPEKIGEVEYFKTGWALNDDKNAIKSMYNYFMGMDTPQQLQLNSMVETEYSKYIKEISRPQEECWLEYYVNKNKDGVTQKYTTTALFDNYAAWAIETKQSFTMSLRKFQIQLKNAITNTTSHIKYFKSNGGVMVCRFDWDGIVSEGKINIFVGDNDADIDEVPQNEIIDDDIGGDVC